MKELVGRTQALRELSDSLAEKNELKKMQVYWRNQPVGNLAGLVEEAVDLVISPADNAARLFRFIGQLEGTLHDRQVGIKHMAPSWDWGTVITILPRSRTLADLIDKLDNMTDVEKVEAEPLAGSAISTFPKRFGFLTRLGISPSKRIHVTLKQTSIARQELATA